MEDLKRETWEAPMTLGPWTVRSCKAGYLIEGQTGRVVRGSGGVASGPTPASSQSHWKC
jgi:hypothetical protein